MKFALLKNGKVIKQNDEYIWELADFLRLAVNSGMLFDLFVWWLEEKNDLEWDSKCAHEQCLIRIKNRIYIQSYFEDTIPNCFNVTREEMLEIIINWAKIYELARKKDKNILITQNDSGQVKFSLKDSEEVNLGQD